MLAHALDVEVEKLPPNKRALRASRVLGLGVGGGVSGTHAASGCSVLNTTSRTDRCAGIFVLNSS